MEENNVPTGNVVGATDGVADQDNQNQPVKQAPSQQAPSAQPEENKKKSGLGCWIIGGIVLVVIVLGVYILSFLGYIPNIFVAFLNLFV